MEFKKIIKAHLDKMAQQDFAFAERYKDEKNSARINDERVETVEVDLTNYTVKQCYGRRDHFTMYHDRIKALVSSQMETIKAYNKNRRSTKIKIAV